MRTGFIARLSAVNRAEGREAGCALSGANCCIETFVGNEFCTLIHKRHGAQEGFGKRLGIGVGFTLAADC